MNYKSVFFVLGMTFLLACTEVSEDLEVKIYGQGAGYSGTYAVDDASEEYPFECTASTSDIYQHTETVTVTEQVVINIFPEASADEDDADDETDMTALTCRITNDAGEIVFEESYSISSTGMKSFVYKLGDELSTDS